MSEQTASVGVTDASTTSDLGRAALAGVLAGVVFGVMIQFVLGRMTAIGAMYTLGDPSLSVGWAAHLGHSAIFGVLFGIIAWSATVGNRVEMPGGAALAGGAFGGLLWAVNIGFIWPVWLNAVGVGDGLPVPYVAPRPLVGHLVWGVLLGVLYWTLQK